ALILENEVDITSNNETAGALKLIKLLAELYLLQLISKIEKGVLKSYSVNPADIIQLTIIHLMYLLGLNIGI
ncbi:20095_t:CDS:2, partial [Gigaspora margarita]